jgi:signal transduction histidine kinase
VTLRPGTLSAKILAGTSLTVVLTALIGSFFLARLQGTALEKAFDKQNLSVASTVAVFSIEPLLTMDYPVLEHALNVAGRANDSILYIEIMHRGVVVASYGTPGHSGRPFSHEIRTHEGAGGKIGDVYAVFSTRDHDALIAHNLRDIAAGTLIVLVAFGLALMWLLRLTVIRPIEKLTAQTEEMIAGALPELADTSVPPPADSDPVRLLGERFATLFAGLRRRDAARRAAEVELLDHKENLERLVETRTRALTDAREEANRLNKTKSEFLAAASHDLRQPIQAISLFQSTLASSGLNADQARLNGHIASALASLSDILNTLLDISKLDSGAVVANPRAVSSSALFSSINDSFASIAREKGLRFKLWFPVAEVTLHTDPTLLFSLLRNLIDNAIKYTSRGGVLVGLRRRGDKALLQVWDTGIGISGEDARNIFDEYVQIGNPERDRGKGLGLGLSIVQRLCGLLGTYVRVRSIPGRGSLFELDIPVTGTSSWSAEGIQNENLRRSRPTPEGVRNRNVIVVEDDVLVAESLTASLEAEGASVRRYADGATALTCSHVDNADIVISDHWLPGGLNGAELIPRLAKRARPGLRSILISGDPTAKLTPELEALGCRLLYKPVRLAELMSALASR